MADANDNFLLREYAERHSESAFNELVRRHVNFVYSVAMRYVGNPPDAQDVTQAVFVILAQKSSALCRRTTLTGWLYETTRLTSRQTMRGRARRLAREQEAYMQFTSDPSGGDALWCRLAPHLEEAMSRLRAADRELLALRFYENKTGAEAAALLGIGAAAAHKRTNRALEKLQSYFARRGVSSTTAIIAGTISANSVQAAPVGLAQTISAVAIAKGAAASTSTLTYGALKIMAWTKTQTAIVAGAGILLAAGTTTIVVTQIHRHSTSAISAEIPGNDDSIFWKSSALFSLPANILALRPSHFARERGAVVDIRGVFLGKQQCRMAGAGQTLPNVLSMAYLASRSRMILPPDAPQGRFDFLITLPATNQEQQIERLQGKITRQLGLVGHKVTIETNVLLLQVANANAQGLKPHVGQDSADEDRAGKMYYKGQDINLLVGSVEYAVNQPVINDTGMVGRYDFVLDENVFNGKASREAIDKTLMDQFGLDLVPATRPVEFLVMEKAK